MISIPTSFATPGFAMLGGSCVSGQSKARLGRWTRSDEQQYAAAQQRFAMAHVGMYVHVPGTALTITPTRDARTSAPKRRT